MVSLRAYDFGKKQESTIDVNNDIFDVEVKRDILHFVVTAYRAKARAGTAKAKTRGEVRGGGSKPWRQKGTGRARSGTKTSPLWNGGGVVFGPQPRSYEKKVNKKIKRLALKMALTAKRDETVILKDFKVDEPKTKLAVQMLSDAKIEKPLIVVSQKDESLVRATNNIANLKMIELKQLNVYDILKYKNLCLSADALELINKEF